MPSNTPLKWTVLTLSAAYKAAFSGKTAHFSPSRITRPAVSHAPLSLGSNIAAFRFRQPPTRHVRKADDNSPRTQ